MATSLTFRVRLFQLVGAVTQKALVPILMLVLGMISCICLPDRKERDGMYLESSGFGILAAAAGESCR